MPDLPTVPPTSALDGGRPREAATVGELRRLLEGVPDDVVIGLVERYGGERTDNYPTPTFAWNLRTNRIEVDQ